MIGEFAQLWIEVWRSGGDAKQQRRIGGAFWKGAEQWDGFEVDRIEFVFGDYQAGGKGIAGEGEDILGGVIGFLNDALGVNPKGGVRFSALGDRPILDFQKWDQFTRVVDRLDHFDGFESAFRDSHAERIEVSDGTDFFGLHWGALQGFFEGEWPEFGCSPRYACRVDNLFAVRVGGDLIDGKSVVDHTGLEASFV